MYISSTENINNQLDFNVIVHEYNYIFHLSYRVREFGINISSIVEGYNKGIKFIENSTNHNYYIVKD